MKKRSVPVFMRLAPAEFAALSGVAEADGLPVATTARRLLKGAIASLPGARFEADANAGRANPVARLTAPAPLPREG
jgi:hypothetical protein